MHDGSPLRLVDRFGAQVLVVPECLEATPDLAAFYSRLAADPRVARVRRGALRGAISARVWDAFEGVVRRLRVSLFPYRNGIL